MGGSAGGRDPEPFFRRTGHRPQKLEAAYVFHNCKRGTVGLPQTRRREWLLHIAFGKRETFAYACEAYARIVELGETRAARLVLVDELAAGSRPPDERVEGDEYADVLREAAAARNGWRHILARCAPPLTRCPSRRYKGVRRHDGSSDARRDLERDGDVVQGASAPGG